MPAAPLHVRTRLFMFSTFRSPSWAELNYWSLYIQLSYYYHIAGNFRRSKHSWLSNMYSVRGHYFRGCCLHWRSLHSQVKYSCSRSGESTTKTTKICPYESYPLYSTQSTSILTLYTGFRMQGFWGAANCKFQFAHRLLIANEQTVHMRIAYNMLKTQPGFYIVIRKFASETRYTAAESLRPPPPTET